MGPVSRLKRVSYMIFAAVYCSGGVAMNAATIVCGGPLPLSTRGALTHLSFMAKYADIFEETTQNWPFQRILGIQEPASAVSSVLNLATNAYMYTKILRDTRFSLKNTKLLLFWHLFAVVCMNAWVWSTIFHTRDTPFTEFMDYACALSMVMGLFVAAIVRVLHNYKRVCGLLLMAALVYYAEHAQYLYTGRIDYDYNMAVNVCCGVMGSFLWTAWCVYHWQRTGSRYVWRMVAFNKLSGAALLLEVLDFPPVMRAWDAHALWHLSTAPLPLLFYRFVIDDLEYLQQATKISEKTDLKIA